MDTGCTCIIVSESVVPNLVDENCRRVPVTDFVGNCYQLPATRVLSNRKFFYGWTDAFVAPIKSCAVFVGNVSGVVDPVSENAEQVSVVTR